MYRQTYLDPSFATCQTSRLCTSLNFLLVSAARHLSHVHGSLGWNRVTHHAVVAVWRIRGHSGWHWLLLVLNHVGVVGLRMYHGRCAVHVRRWEVLRLRLHVCAFKVLDGGQRHGHCARRRAAIVGRGQLLAVGRTVVLWVLMLVMLLLLVLLDWRERRRALHLWRGLLLRVFVTVLLLLFLLLDDGRGRRRAMRRSRGLVVYYCWRCWVLVHGGDRDHSRGGVTCTVAAAVGSLR
jgi:hypothetical protein